MTAPPLPRRFRRRRGVALILTLLVLSVLVVVVAQLSFSTKLDVKIAQNYRGDVQNTYAVRAGINYAKLFLKADMENAGDVDSLHETWARTFEPVIIGDVELMLWIEDEDRKLNVNLLVDQNGAVIARNKEIYERLLKILRVSDNTLAARLVDYLDRNTDGLFEKDAKNAALYSTRELRRIEGYTDAILFGGDPSSQDALPLLPHITAWGPPQINVNTASAEALQSIHPEMSMEAARAIVNWRAIESAPGKGNTFQQLPGDFSKVPGFPKDLGAKIAPLLTVKSSVFLVHLRARQGSIERRVQAILRREQGIVKMMALFQDQTFQSVGILDEEGEREGEK